MMNTMKPTKSRMRVLKAKAEADALWFRMCSHDGIQPNSTFVVFSQSNPFQAEYNEAMREYQTALKADKVAQARNATRRARHDALVSCGLTRVRVNGKVFYE